MEIISLFILIILTVIILSALVSGSEAALLSLTYPQAKELLTNSENKKQKHIAKNLILIKDNIHKYITTIVVLNNIVNIVGSMIVGLIAAKQFSNIVVGLISALLTFLIILFAEIIPKLYGEKYSLKISIIISSPLIFLTKLLKPIVIVLETLAKLFIDTSKVENQVTEGVIKEMAIIGQLEGSINKYESDLIENVFEMNDTKISEIMIPKNKVIALNKNSKFDEIAKMVEETGFTRFPIEGNDGEIIGLINAKDLFKFHKKIKDFKISRILRPIIFAPETMKVSTLEAKLKRNRIHMASVVNEHGDNIGILTLEDIIEEIIGEIEDEFDLAEENKIIKISERKWKINPSIDIANLNAGLDLNLESSDLYSNLNGFLSHKFDGIPNTNAKYEIKEGVFRIIHRTKKKIIEVEFRKIK